MNPQQESPQIEQMQSNSNLVVSNSVKQNNTLVIILSVLLLISISVSSYFAYQTQMLINKLQSMDDSKKEELQETKQLQDYEQPTTQRLSSKTYTNNEHLFTFDYPSEWTVESRSSDILLISYSLPTKQRFFVTYHISYSIAEWLDDTQSGKIIGKKQIGDNVFTQVEGGLALNSLEYLLENKGKGFVRFVLEPSSNKIESEEIFNQILSTFKFTD